MLREAFGIVKSRNTGYVRAMKRKLAGGDFLDSLEDVVGPSVSAIRAKYDLSDADQRTQCQNDVAAAIKKKIPTVRRVFHNAVLLENDRHLTKSKDTVYVEQEILMEELEKRGLTKLAFVGGMNIDTMLVLTRLGLFDPSTIREPGQYTRRIWEELRHKYEKAQVANLDSNGKNEDEAEMSQ
jgi:hypothetical protein